MAPRRFPLPRGLSRRNILPLGLSLLLHVLVAAILAVTPIGPPEAPDVVPVEFFDLPRTTDFSPPEAGIVQGGVEEPRPAPAAKGAPSPPPGEDRGAAEQGAREAAAREAAARESAAREEAARESAAREEAAREAARRDARESASREAAARESAAREAAAKDAAAKEARERAAREEEERRRREAREKGKGSIVPSLGSLVRAQGAPGGRGNQPSSGSAVGTDAKARERGEIAEEGGGSFQLTTLNAPEVQYAGYFDSIRRKIELVWQYPYDAAVAGIGGELLLDFVVGRGGRVERVTLVRGSGHKVLDEEAIRAVQKASPFNPIPKDFDVPELLIRGRFIYSHGGIRQIR